MSNVFNKKIKLFSTFFLPLSKAPFCSVFRVIYVNLPQEQALRLLHLGIFAGAIVCPCGNAPFYTATCYVTANGQIALDKQTTNNIIVKEVDRENNLFDRKP